MTPVEERPAAASHGVARAAAKAPDAVFRLALPCFLYYLIFYVVTPPLPIRVEENLVDPSWRIVLTDAFLRGAQFGRDLIYTYGPWGFLENTQGDPRIYPWAVSAKLLIALAFSCGVALILARTVRRPAMQALLLAWIALLSDPVYVLPMILLGVASHCDLRKSRIENATLHLVAIATALTMWIKFTSFVTVAALAVALAAHDLLRRRRPLIPLEIAAAALAFWLIARQSLLGIPVFLHGALSTAMSYSSEMFIPGRHAELTLVLAFLLAVAVPLAMNAGARKILRHWPLIGWVLLLFFLQMKEAYVRYDVFHVWMGIVNALLPCALILSCRMECFSQSANRLTRLCALGAVVLSVALGAIELRTYAGFERFQWMSQNMADLRALASSRSLQTAYREQLTSFRRTAPLLPVTGTADFFPDAQILLYGNGLSVHTPPMPQSFSAYNAYLSGRNAEFFRGPQRPEFVFFDIAPIDRRYPTAEDPLSWRALLDCYLPSGNSGKYLVLRAAGCVSGSLDFISQVSVPDGKTIAVPRTDGEPVWVEIDMRLNPAGAVLAMVSHPATTKLSITTPRGKHDYAVTIQTARMGFLLSPLLRDASSFARLFAEGAADPAEQVDDITFVRGSEDRRYYQPSIAVKFYRLNLARHLSTN